MKGRFIRGLQLVHAPTPMLSNVRARRHISRSSAYKTEWATYPMRRCRKNAPRVKNMGCVRSSAPRRHTDVSQCHGSRVGDKPPDRHTIAESLRGISVAWHSVRCKQATTEIRSHSNGPRTLIPSLRRSKVVKRHQEHCTTACRRRRGWDGMSCFPTRAGCSRARTAKAFQTGPGPGKEHRHTRCRHPYTSRIVQARGIVRIR